MNLAIQKLGHGSELTSSSKVQKMTDIIGPREVNKRLPNLFYVVSSVLLLPIVAITYTAATIFHYPTVVIAFLTPLTTILLDRPLPLIGNLYPFLIVAGVVTFAVILWPSFPVDLKQFVQVNKLPLFLFIFVLIGEAVSAYINNLSIFSEFFLGRLAMIMLMTVVGVAAMRRRDYRKEFLAFAVGMGILGLLTILHVYGIFSLPFAMRILPPRTFLGIQFPVSRTLGIAMSFGKFGIMASFALAALLLPVPEKAKTTALRFIKPILLFLIISGILIAQGRGIFVTVLASLLVSLLLAVAFRENESRAERPSVKQNRALILIMIMVATSAVYSTLFSNSLVDANVFDVQSNIGQLNIITRVQSNQAGLQLLFENPIWGIGHGQYTTLSNAQISLHNHFLEQFVATGFLTGTAYLLFFFILMIRTWQIIVLPADPMQRNTASILFVGLFATIMEYFVFPGFFTEAFIIIGGLMMALHTFIQDQTAKYNL